MDYLYSLTFYVLEPPNLKLRKPSWVTTPSPMFVFFCILASYYLVTGEHEYKTSGVDASNPKAVGYKSLTKRIIGRSVPPEALNVCCNNIDAWLNRDHFQSLEFIISLPDELNRKLRKCVKEIVGNGQIYADAINGLNFYDHCTDFIEKAKAINIEEGIRA